MTQTAILKNRRCTVQVADLLIETGDGKGLDVSFKSRRGLHVTRGSLKPQPNTCDLSIYNLSPDHRREIEKSTIPVSGGTPNTVPVVISAGYADRVSVVFSGQMRSGYSVTDGPDIVTELTTGDGDQALAQARLTLALGPGSTAEQGLRKIVESLGVDDGNLAKAVSLLSQQPLASQMFSRGGAFKGAAAEIMSDFCRSVGLEWSVQNGALQVTALGQPLDGEAILIDSDHGMIGSPTVDTKGVLAVKTLMIPDVKPGGKIVVHSLTDACNGGFRIIGIETSGSTFSNDWGHSIEAVRY